MANPLYVQMNSQNSFASMLNDLKSNPMQFLAQRKFNIPKNLQSDPNSIVQYLLNSGQVSQQQYDRAKAIACNFKR